MNSYHTKVLLLALNSYFSRLIHIGEYMYSNGFNHQLDTSNPKIFVSNPDLNLCSSLQVLPACRIYPVKLTALLNHLY